MNKTANKKIVAIVAVIALVAVLGICLVACNSDNVGKKLEDKGYTVVTLNENANGTGKAIYNTVKDNSDFSEGVWATKGLNNYVAVIWYKSVDAAQDAESSFTSNPLTPVVYRVGKVVYAGTQQGVEDAK